MKKVNKIYKFGDCVQESYKAYNKLKRKEENLVVCEGYVRVKNNIGSDVNRETLIIKDKDKEVLPHTWISSKNKIIDITKNQFNKYNGIKYYIQCFEYKLNKKNKFDSGSGKYIWKITRV